MAETKLSSVALIGLSVVVLVGCLMIGQAPAARFQKDHQISKSLDHSLRRRRPAFLSEAASRYSLQPIRLKPFSYTPGTTYLVSFGGSIAAGAGLSPPYGGSSYPRRCDQTADSFNVQMGDKLGLELDQVACNGATTEHGILSGQHLFIKGSEYTLPSQISQTKREVKNSLVTLFIGANDVRWLSMEYRCATSGCPLSLPSLYRQGLLAIKDGVKQTLVKLRSEGARMVVVDQYFSAFSASTTRGCRFVRISESNLKLYKERLGQLNNAIREGADSSRVALLVEPNFSGHGICSKDPWVQSLGDLRPFHPNAAGQAELASQNIQAIKRRQTTF